jgi:hypothetical protein
MDKISSIVPSNARITAVDLKSSGVARSGTPGFGREVNSTNDRLHNHTDAATAAAARHNDQMTLRQPTRDEKAQIVSKMTEKFFSSKAKEDQLPEIKPEEKFNIEDMQLASPVATKPSMDPGKGGIHQLSEAVAEEEAPSVGGRLDVHA